MNHDLVRELGDRDGEPELGDAGRIRRPRAMTAADGLSFVVVADRTADALTGAADTITTSARELRQQAERWAARADEVARGLCRTADRLRASSAGAVADDVVRAAGRHPGVVLSGAILLGLGAAIYMAGGSPRRGGPA